MIDIRCCCVVFLRHLTTKIRRQQLKTCFFNILVVKLVRIIISFDATSAPLPLMRFGF